jgi:hypothetical protein
MNTKKAPKVRSDDTTRPPEACSWLAAFLRALTPLIYAHVTPYGTFRLELNQRLAIEQDAIAA